MSAPEKSAYDLLVSAIENYMREEGRIDEGWALGDWMICLEQVPFAPELKDRQRYGIITPEPSIPIHRLLGLLTVIDDDLRTPDDD